LCGTDASENIYGTSGDDVIFAYGGDDKIIPYGGNDIVYAGPGKDEVRHSFGNDYILGGSGYDTLRGGFDNDVIWGGPDKDLIDCAYLPQRAKGEDYDTAYANNGEDPNTGEHWEDLVVDCKDTTWGDQTDDTTTISLDPDNPGQPIVNQ
jgi:Ca2+-binding RTX toxin-like protein